MKILTFVLVFFTLTLNFAQDRNSKTVIFYEYSYKPDSLNISKIISDKMVLLISENQSLYKSYTKMKRDSMITNNFNNGIYEINFSNLPKVRVFHQVYRDFKNDSVKVVDRIATKDFIFPTGKLNWILGKDRRKITGFDCQNAYCSIGNRKFEAWFTTSVLPNEDLIDLKDYLV